MPNDDANLQALTVNFRRCLADSTLSTGALKDIAATALARVLDGTTIIEVTIEGELTRAVTNCAPSIVLAAAEALLAESDAGNVLSVSDANRKRYLDFSGGRIET